MSIVFYPICRDYFETHSSPDLPASKTNYHFVEWNTRPDGTGTSLANYGRVTGPVTFYAVYYQSDYFYTGSPQTFIAPVNGWYQVQLWGAEGGSDNSAEGTPHMGGKGAYVSGEVYLTAATRLYVYVGAEGIDHVKAPGHNFNGGANSGSYGDDSGSGGGATDIRTINGAWNNAASLKSRIMVAAGGGGGGWFSSGGHAGGLTGGASEGGVSGGTQYSAGHNGGFGYGGVVTEDVYGVDGGGGGGGWYGGGAGTGDQGGGGGSSYISGYSGCSVSSTGYTFRNARMIPGSASMPAPGGGTEVGHTGPCRAIIRLIERG